MLKGRHGNTLIEQDKIKKNWEQYTKERYRKDERMTESFKNKLLKVNLQFYKVK